MNLLTKLASAGLLTLTSTACTYNSPKLEDCLSTDQIPIFNSGDRVKRKFYAFAGLESSFGSGNISDARYHAQYCAKNFPNSEYELIRLDHWQRHATRIKEDIRRGREIIFIGHSLGCREALDAAKCLEGENVHIGLVFLDAVSLEEPALAIGHQQTIPKNVDWVLNYVSAYGPFSGPKEIPSNLLDSRETRVQSFIFNTSHAGFFGDPYLASCAEDIGKIIGIVPGKEPLYPKYNKTTINSNPVVPGIRQNPQ